MAEIAREWVQIAESGTVDRIVFKSSDSDIPPSRGGRRTLALEPDGTAQVLEPGPVDRSEPVAEGHWSLDGHRLHTDLDVLGGDFTIEQPDPSTLILRPAGEDADPQR